MKKIWFAWILLHLVILVACGLLAPGGGTTGEVAPPPTTEEGGSNGSPDLDQGETQGEAATHTPPPSPTEAPSNSVEGADLSTFNLDDPSQYLPSEIINSFQSSIRFSFKGTDEDGTSFDSSLVIEGVMVLDPPASSLSFQTIGEAGTEVGESISVVELDGAFYALTPEFGCFVSTSPVEMDLYDDFLSQRGDLQGIANRLPPDEEINGMVAYVYEITLDNIAPEAVTALGIEVLETGRIYVSREHLAITRIFMKGFGSSNVLTGNTEVLGEVEYEINYFDFDTGLQVQVPEGCAELGEIPYPIPEDAREMTQLPGVFSYQSGETGEALGDLYKTRMPDLGYTLTEEFGTSSLLSLTFSGNGEEVVIFIGSDPDTGESAVTINVQTP